jgi:phosphatidylglycerophosphate synthase
MKLHRADTTPDWELVAAGKRNVWQQWAVRTRGIVTPGNVASGLGVLLVGVGLAYIGRGRLWLGLIILTAGRLLDIIDGAIAERTGTKSPLGESVDASLDKTAVFAALIVFTAVGILPLPFALFVGLQNGVTAVLSLVAKSLRRTIHPVHAGKIGGALVWVALLGFVLGAAVHAGFAPVFTALAYILALVSVALNTYATIRYAQAFHAQR